MPFLSVVIPVFNRERELRRALESCVAQTGADFEVVVVDDCSFDRSCAVAEEYAGRGVRLIRHNVNQGSSPARNHGAEAARGEWLVRFDSDDELLPGALLAIETYARQAAPSVGRFGLMYRYGDGRVSPYPPPDGRALSYDGFASSIENTELWDALTVYRRSAFLAEPLPPGRLMELLHAFNFARRFDTVWLPQFGLLYHVNADNRQSRDLPGAEECRQHAAEAQLLISQHGEVLRKCAPRFLAAQRRRAAVFLAISGARRLALRLALSQTLRTPLSLLNWSCLAGVAAGRAGLRPALKLKWWLVERKRMRMCKPA